MKKFPKVRRIGHPSTDGLFDENGEIVIQEKMDGANFRIYLNLDDNGEPVVEFGSRNQTYENVDDDDIPKSFRPTIDYANDKLTTNQIIGLVQDEGPVTVFGESMHSHTLDYDWENTPRFLGFDVWSHRDSEWRHPTGALNIIESLGFETVPLYGIPGLGTMIPVDEFNMDEWEEPESHYRDGLSEGIVLRNTHTCVRAKFVTEAFAEKHGGTKPGKAPEGLSDAQRMAERYTGPDNRRIRKQVLKLVEDEGHDLEMELMPELGPAVVEDIAIEEANDFICENWTVDFHQFRKVVNKQCVETIKKMMQERSQQKVTA